MARLGEAWPGRAGRGKAGRGEARRGEAGRGKARLGEAGRGLMTNIINGTVPHPSATWRPPLTRARGFHLAGAPSGPRGRSGRMGQLDLGEARRGWAGPGMARHGEARLGGARQGEARQGMADDSPPCYLFGCTRGAECEWQCYALYRGFSWGRLRDTPSAWREAHDRYRTGRLVQWEITAREIKG